MKILWLIPFVLFSMVGHAQSSDEALMAGLSAMKKQDHTAAQAAFDAVVSSEPNNGKAWYYRAVNRLGMGDAEGAVKDLDHLLIMEPADVHAMLRRAEAYRALGEGAKANSDLHRVLGLHANGPATESALIELGRVAMEALDLPNALSLYDRLVGIAPYNALAWFDRGVTRSALRDDDNALSDLEKAIDLDPSLGQAHAALGQVLLRQGRRQEGCFALQQAHHLGERSVEQLMLINCD